MNRPTTGTTIKMDNHHTKEIPRQNEDNRQNTPPRRHAATHWTTPFAVPTSLSTTSNQIVCHLPVAKEKEPRASEVP
jgi:hypothetical protein